MSRAVGASQGTHTLLRLASWGGFSRSPLLVALQPGQTSWQTQQIGDRNAVQMLLSSSHMEQVQKAANFFWKFKELHKATQQLQQLSPYPFLPGAQALKGSTAASCKQTWFLVSEKDDAHFTSSQGAEFRLCQVDRSSSNAASKRERSASSIPLALHLAPRLSETKPTVIVDTQLFF